ncbi:YbaB/EbfC family nucleoid-associated protein [Allorhodopirellula solitaria]|uniref:Nucleoid-associated protein n=1 Tax=Allorhodopirellula solitaria TaxID=2527987 RepID=A0A5C5YKG0_9BACT|nr:YbaB/EbfC family nucleoid-associated protein [Allorhodopirellula solitaria]TWT75309.1 Nucleoid-associated protein [Allorhodopirellula solitaria]
MFKGLGNLGNIASMIGKLQDLPDHMRQLNERMKSERVTASSSCGHVTVTMNGIGEVQAVDVSPEVFGEAASDALPPERLCQAIQEATNAAGADAKQLYADSVSQLASDLDVNIPGMDGILASITGGNG